MFSRIALWSTSTWCTPVTSCLSWWSRSSATPSSRDVHPRSRWFTRSARQTRWAKALIILILVLCFPRSFWSAVIDWSPFHDSCWRFYRLLHMACLHIYKYFGMGEGGYQTGIMCIIMNHSVVWKVWIAVFEMTSQSAQIYLITWWLNYGNGWISAEVLFACFRMYICNSFFWGKLNLLSS